MEVQHVKSHPRGGEWNQYLKILIAIPSPQNETAGNLPLTLTFVKGGGGGVVNPMQWTKSLS